MRSSPLLRLATALILVAVVGLAGLNTLDSATAEAQSSVYGLAASNAWTGVLAAPAEAQATGDPNESSEGLIVRFQPREAHASQINAHQAAGARSARALALSDTVRVDVKQGERDRALAAYNARPDVLYAEPDYTVYALYTPNDPQFSHQWGPQKIAAQTAWDITRGTSSVRVAIVDCGVFGEATGRLAADGQAGHPDLRGRVSFNQDFTGSSTGFDDYCDHGTHVAGIVGATGNNGVGISGLAPHVTLMNAKVLGDNGKGSTSNILNGIVWAVQNGATVINLSLGRDGPCSQSERDTMNWAYSQGVVVVAAAGNSSLGASGAPANCDNVISVASTTSTDARSSFSNYGTGVDVAAPGSSIISAVRTGDYEYLGGTSMASPHVAGLAGLLWSQNPNATAQAVIDRIRTTSDPIGGTGTLWSWGRINAATALTGWGSGEATATPTATQTATQTPTSVPSNTATPTATSTPTQVPPPPTVACPSPRPPVQLTTRASGATSLDVTVTAGAGVIREIDFRELQNAAVRIGSQDNATSPFLYRPASYGSQAEFTVSQQSGSQAATVSLAILDDCGTWTTFVGGGTSTFQRGTIAGTVRNTTTSQPVAGATVTVHGTSHSSTTNGNGDFSIGEVPAGNVTLNVSAQGYLPQTIPATVQQKQTSTVNVSLVPTVSTQDISVVLTWGASPADLDIHLSGPAGNGDRFHTYWNDRDAASYVTISADVRNGFGPETVTIAQRPQTGAWVPGEYRIWAHTYSAVQGYSGSSAKVTVTRGGQQLGDYDVANASGTSSNALWRSVNLTVDANGNVSLAPVQQIVSGGSNTVLRLEDGANGVVQWPATGKR